MVNLELKSVDNFIQFQEKTINELRNIIQELQCELANAKNTGRTTCWACGGQIIWGGDFSFEDYDLDGEGVVSNLCCSDCGADYEVSVAEATDETKERKGE